MLNRNRAAVDGMCEHGRGRIIMGSSDAGHVGLAIGVSLYGAGKAVELSAMGVTANVVSLGLMNNVPEEFTGPLIKTIPTRRLGDPADVGHAIAYPASDEASRVTGSTLVANGGSQPF